MRAAELRKHIGKKIEWEYAHDRHRGTCLVRKGVLLEVAGKNVMVDMGGVGDWFWLPQMVNLIVHEQEE